MNQRGEILRMGADVNDVKSRPTKSLKAWVLLTIVAMGAQGAIPTMGMTQPTQPSGKASDAVSPKVDKPYKAAANLSEAIQRIEELGGLVRHATKASKEVEAYEVDFQRGASAVADVHLQYLQQLPKIEILRLRETAITDAGLELVGKIHTLKRLHLEKTAITDAGLKHLRELKSLEYLNVFGTAVSNAGLEQLLIKDKGLPKLRSLYVWETKVTLAAIQRFQQDRPTLQITPDPKQERTRAEAAWKTARTLLEEAEQELKVATKEAEVLPPRAAQLKKEAEEALKTFNEARKMADAAKKQTEVTAKRARELQSEAQRNPGNTDRQKQANEAKLQAEEARKREQSLSEMAKKAQAQHDTVRKLSNKASNARKLVAEALLIAEGARRQEAETRRALELLMGKE